MVDEVRVLRLVGELRRRTAALRAARTADLADEVQLNSVKYLFVTAIEAGIDIAQHVVASEGLGLPGSNREAFELLARHGVVDDELARRWGAACGFRNVLVHGYAEVDDTIVVAQLDRLDDLDALAHAVAEHLDAHG